MSKKNITMIASIVGVFVFVAVIASTSYAYFVANVETKNTDNNTTTVQTGDVKAEFVDNEDLTVTNLIPGETFSKTFMVKNTGTTTIKYKIKLNNVENTFERTGDLTYVIKENGTIVKDGEALPTTSAPISDVLTIQKGVTNTYTLEVTYNNSTTEDQSVDMGKTISGKIFIEETN